MKLRNSDSALAVLAVGLGTLQLFTCRASSLEADSGSGTPDRTAAAPQSGAGQATTLDALFSALDANHDGRISKDEAAGRYASRFPQWDADGDGFATRQEIHDYRGSVGIDDAGRRIAGGGTSPARTAAGGAGNQRRAAAPATVLKEPADWRLETMPVPTGFAPDIKLKGSEEIRFAPGMFDTASANYFTCILAVMVDDAPALGAAELQDFLEKYYRGLSTGLARRKGLKVDPAEMIATVKPAGPDAKDRFLGTVVFFDSFNDGRRITLNFEARVITQPLLKRSVLLLLVSPSPKESAAWQALREVGQKAAANAVPKE
jgi:hypothetical protein